MMSQIKNRQQGVLEAVATSSVMQQTRQAVIAPAASIGHSAPLGAKVCHDGVNFNLFSRKASSVELLFFDREDDARPAQVININPSTNRTYHYWHVFVPSRATRADLRLSSPRTVRSGKRSSL